MYNVLDNDGKLAALGHHHGQMLVAPIASRGVVPTVFADQFIKFRVPYSQSGELTIDPGQQGLFFPEDLFKTNIDKPFEIWRMIIRLTAFDDAATPAIIEPQPTTLGKRIRIDVEDTAKNQKITKSPTLIDSLLTDNAKTWEWEVPYTLVTTEGLMIKCDAQLFPTFVNPLAGAPAGSQNVVVNQVRIEIVLQGYLLVLHPPPQGT